MSKASCAVWGAMIAACIWGAAPALAADPPPTPEVAVVDAMQALFGKHPGFRANHAKGVVLDATFAPTPEAAALSKAALFAAPATAVVRFSNPTGVPDIPDNDANANPKGMAVQFTDKDGGLMSMATISAPVFPVATAADFRDFFLALLATKPESPKPTPLEQFIGAHPSVVAFAQSVPAIPASFATQTYYGLNAFKLIAKDGTTTNVRFRLTPEAGEQRLSADELKAKSANFLFDEIGERVKKGAVKFKLVAQIGAKDDPTNDATKRWPEDRKIVDLGELVITDRVANSAEAEKSLVFMPTQLVDGVEPSDDPLIESRTEAYAESYGRRQ
jgi:catalase